MSHELDYEVSRNYWSQVPPTVDGVLGGFGEGTVVPKVDASGSLAFVRRLGTLSHRTFPNYIQPDGLKLALDVGAGIGRVTKSVLSQFSDAVDLLEPSKQLIKRAQNDIGGLNYTRNFYQVAMQDFDFASADKYWVVWCQWCLGNLRDDALVKFLSDAAANLQRGGIIVVKENISSIEDEFDSQDSSVTRTDITFRKIFHRANLKLLLTTVQKGMPEELYPVRMYALGPASVS